MYDFLTGPMLWLTFIVTFFGLAFRAVWYVRGLHWQMDRVAYKPHFKYGMRGALRSIFYFLLPFGSRSWRERAADVRRSRQHLRVGRCVCA